MIYYFPGDEEIAELNEDVSLDNDGKNDSTYKLHIYNRGNIGPKGIPKIGHFFVSLEKNGKEQPFGLYPAKNFLTGYGEIKESHEMLFAYNILLRSVKNGERRLNRKTINLAPEEYLKARKFIWKLLVSRKVTYIFGKYDCTDFVQSVYHAAGLPLHYALLYTADEISHLKGLAAWKVDYKYGNLDKAHTLFQEITAESKEKVCEKFNVKEKDVECLGRCWYSFYKSRYSINLKEYLQILNSKKEQ